MQTVRVAFLDKVHAQSRAILQRHMPKGWILDFVQDRLERSHPDSLRDCDVAFVIAAPVTGEMIANAPRLRLVQKLGAGVDRVDLPACRKSGVALARLAASNALPVAEHTVLLMLAVMRLLPAMDRATRHGSWLKEEARATTQHLHGKTVGLLGVGAIGSAVARLLQGFGVTLLYSKPRRLEVDSEAALGLTYVDRDELLARSDVLSLHLPLTAETRNILDASALARMKPGAILVNTARGGLVDETALLGALETGHLFGAGIDVFETEPPVGSALLASQRVVVTPHLAGATSTNFESVVRRAVANAQCALAGDPLPVTDLVAAA